MRKQHPKRVENYTDAFLAVAGLILFMSFWVLATWAGTFWVAAAALGLNQSINWLGQGRMLR